MTTASIERQILDHLADAVAAMTDAQQQGDAAAAYTAAAARLGGLNPSDLLGVASMIAALAVTHLRPPVIDDLGLWCQAAGFAVAMTPTPEGTPPGR